MSPGAKDDFESPLQKYCNDNFDNLMMNVEELQRWSSTPEEGVASDEVETVAMSVTQQFGLTCHIFAAVRSFNCRSHTAFATAFGAVVCFCVLVTPASVCAKLGSTRIWRGTEGGGS